MEEEKENNSDDRMEEEKENGDERMSVKMAWLYTRA